MSTRALLAFCAVLFAATAANAVEVYVNGVKVSGALRGQVLDVTQVRFAENGDVYVDAPGYKIELDEGATAPGAAGAGLAAGAVAGAATGVAAAAGAAAGAAAPSAAPASAAEPATPPPAGFWLIVNNSKPGHYKVQVVANGKPVVDVPAERPQFVTDLSSHLKAGDNAIAINFMPAPGAPAVAETQAVSVMVGQGKNGADGTLTIEQVLGSIKHPTGRLSAEQQVIRFKLAQ